MNCERLTAPMKVGNTIYKNRMIASPIYCGPFINLPGLSTVLTNAMIERASGGCAQVTIGETAVNFHGACHNSYPPIDYADYNDPTMAKFKDLVGKVHGYGAKILIELAHCGNSFAIPGLVPFGLGPVDEVLENGVEIHAMTEQDMADVTADFIQSAKWMREAGFDGAMIHAGHGWLLHQFLSARVNTRTDEYGGSPENRAKFPLQLLRSVREAMGPDFVIEMRVSGEEGGENGMHADETAAFCRMAEPYVDIIHVSVGTYRNPILSGQFSSMFDPHALNSAAAKVIKDAVSIPVVMVGGINCAEDGERVIEEGVCDAIAMGRQLTADPDFAKKVIEGRPEEINPCIRCYKCFPAQIESVDLNELANIFGCTVNPREFYYDFDLLNRVPKVKKNVLVVGGGMAGMRAALTAKEKGHNVTLLEKRDRLGGVLYFTDTDHLKTDMRKMKDLLAMQVEKSGVNVVLNHTFTEEDLNTYKPDHVIIAVGAHPVKPPIKGIDNALQALELYPDIDKAGQNVVMVGGGLVGCEVGLHLAETGRKVTVIEMGPKVAPDSYAMHREALMREMDRIEVHTSTRCMEIRKDGITALDADGNEVTYTGDTVIYALGMVANKDIVAAISGACDKAQIPYDVVGDGLKAAKVFEANRQGMIAALKL